MDKKRLIITFLLSIFIAMVSAACSTEQPDVILPTQENADELIQRAEAQLAQLQNEIDDLATRVENGELSEDVNEQVEALEAQLTGAKEQLQQIEGLTPEEQAEVASEFNDVVNELEEAVNTLVDRMQ
jgi:HAMP domain-containing protein